MAKHLLILSTICLMSLVLLAVATGTATENTYVAEIRNYGEVNDEEHRTRRDVAKQGVEEQTVAVVASGRDDEENTNTNSRNNLQPNFGELKASNIVKRAPSGFTGMRGKKKFEITDSNGLSWGEDDLNPNNDNDANDDDSTENHYNLIYGKPNGRRFKKAPTAFYGVRGKKYGSGNADFSRLDDFMQELEEQHMRETMLQNFIDRLAASTAAQNEIAKRAPTGFTGMRGKRPAAGNYYDYDNSEVGVAEKRGPSNAFIGVRGKKDVSHQAFKRSSSSDSFNNARGGGKNQRFVDFSNKFVAVRGKKASLSSSPVSLALGGDDDVGVDDWSTELTSGGRQPQQRYLVNMLPSLLFGSNGKRTQSGVMGMRGKREANALAAHPVE